jgi:hypothetical protein
MIRTPSSLAIWTRRWPGRVPACASCSCRCLAVYRGALLRLQPAPQRPPAAFRPCPAPSPTPPAHCRSMAARPGLPRPARPHRRPSPCPRPLVTSSTGTVQARHEDDRIAPGGRDGPRGPSRRLRRRRTVTPPAAQQAQAGPGLFTLMPIAADPGQGGDRGDPTRPPPGAPPTCSGIGSREMTVHPIKRRYNVRRPARAALGGAAR